MNKALQGLVLGLLLALGGCGGGGDAQIPDEPETPTTEVPPPPTGCSAQPRPVQCL